MKKIYNAPTMKAYIITVKANMLAGSLGTGEDVKENETIDTDSKGSHIWDSLED